MSFEFLLLRHLLWKYGPLKNQLLLYALIAAVILLHFGDKSDPPLRTVLMLGGMVMLFVGPGFWLVAYLKLPATAQERVFEENTAEIVGKHKEIIRSKDADTNHQARR